MNKRIFRLILLTALVLAAVSIPLWTSQGREIDDPGYEMQATNTPEPEVKQESFPPGIDPYPFPEPTDDPYPLPGHRKPTPTITPTEIYIPPTTEVLPTPCCQDEP